MTIDDQLPEKVFEAFKTLIALESDIDRQQSADAWSDPRYIEALDFIFDELQLPRAEKCPVNIADVAPPDWVMAIEEFYYLHHAASADYRYHVAPLRAARRRRRA